MYLRTLALVAVIVLFSALSVADLRPDSTSAQEEAGANIVLLMDHSLSLKETDQEEFRLSAAQLFVELLDAERDRVAIVTFASDAEKITCDAPDSATCFSGDAEYLQDKIATEAGNDSIAAQGGTDLLAGLQATYMLLDNPELPDREAFIILLTDGSPCRPGPAGSLRSTHDDLEYRAAIVDEVDRNRIAASLYALTFTSPDELPVTYSCQDPDKALMEDISRIAGGWARHESSPEAIPDLYTQILTRIRDLDIVLVDAQIALVPPATDVIIATIVGSDPSLDANSSAQSVVINACAAPPVLANVSARSSCLDLRRDRALVVIIDSPSTGGWQFDTGGVGTISVLAETAWGVNVVEPSEGQRFLEGSEIPVRVEIIDADDRVLTDLQDKIQAVLLDSSLTRLNAIDLTAVDGSRAEFVGVLTQEEGLPPGDEEAGFFVAPQITGLDVSAARAVGIVIESVPVILTVLEPGESIKVDEDGSDGVLLAVGVMKDTGEAIDDANAVVDVVDPDGNTYQVILVGGGDGRYEGRFLNVGLEDKYDFTFNVTLADGEVLTEEQTTDIKFKKPRPLWHWIVAGLALLTIAAFIYWRFFIPRFPKEAVVKISDQPLSLWDNASGGIIGAQYITLGPDPPFNVGVESDVAEIRAAGGSVVVRPLADDVSQNSNLIEEDERLAYGDTISGDGWHVRYDIEQETN